MTGYISKKMLGAARLPDTPTARAYLQKVLDNDKDHGDALTISYQSGFHDGKKAALAGREWNFCERCGKRTPDLTTIHTCTPPRENNNG